MFCIIIIDSTFIVFMLLFCNYIIRFTAIILYQLLFVVFLSLLPSFTIYLAGRTGKVVNCLITGQEQEEVRKQEVKQRAMLRRLYMDIEREQVKEYRKLKKHLDRIAELVSLFCITNRDPLYQEIRL